MTLEFLITTAAILLSPLVAVLVTRHLQKRDEERQRKLFVFRALMTTRRSPMSPERVQAINLTEIEFFRVPKVIAAFKELVAVYNDTARWQSEQEAVRQRVLQDVDDKTVKLLDAMGKSLGYQYDNLDLLRGGYIPIAFGILEDEQRQIREFLLELKDGSRGVPVDILDARHPSQLLEQARQANQILNLALTEEKPAGEDGG